MGSHLNVAVKTSNFKLEKGEKCPNLKHTLLAFCLFFGFQMGRRESSLRFDSLIGSAVVVVAALAATLVYFS